MTPRARDVERVIRSLLAYEPGTPTSTGLIVSRAAAGGEIAVEAVECDRCLGERGHTTRFSRGELVPCERCKFVRTKDGLEPCEQSTGVIYVDPVTGNDPFSPTEGERRLLPGEARAMRDAATLASLHRAASIIRQHDGLEGELNEVEAAADALYQTGLSRFEQATRRALEQLKLAEPDAYSVVARICRRPPDADVAPGSRLVFVLALELVAAWTSIGGSRPLTAAERALA